MTQGFRQDMTKAEVNEFPLYRYLGPTLLVRTAEELDAAVAHMQGEFVLGFDTETRPTFAKGKPNLPSLAQLACADRVYLIQLRQSGFTKAFISLLESPDILKTGVAVQDDMRLLQKMTPFTGAGMFDLAEPAKAQGVRLHGLRALAANFLGVRISKSAQCSNWNLRDLTEQQVVYAATDAWISREIFVRMRDLGLISHPGPKARALEPD